MAVQVRPLINAAQAPSGATTQYTAPAGVRTIIDKFTGTNTTAAAATLTVYLVAAGGASGAANRVVAAKSLAAGECYVFPELVGHVLAPGDVIVTESSVNNAVTIRASGREVTY